MKCIWTSILLIAALAGCTPQTWAKPDGNASQFDTDKQQCIYQVNLSPQSNNPFMAYELVKECLRAKGYSQQ
jgi:hypothetical protein